MGGKSGRYHGQVLFHMNQEEKSKYPADRFVFHNVPSTVENLSEHVIQSDIVAVAKVIFRDSILSKDFSAIKS